MGVVVVSVVVALVLAVAIAGIVVVGMRGDLPEVSEKAPELAGRLEWAARQLNGEGQPSSRMADIERAVAGRVGSRRDREDGRSTLLAEPEAVTDQRRSRPAGSLPATGDFGA